MKELKKPKFTHIEYINYKTGEWESQTITAAFALAIVHLTMKNYEHFSGINMGIAIPHENQEEANIFYSNFFPEDYFEKGYKNEEVYVILVGTFLGRECKIPLLFCDGNGLEVEMGTSCLFCYANPDILGPDALPEKQTFGSYILGSKL